MSLLIVLLLTSSSSNLYFIHYYGELSLTNNDANNQVYEVANLTNSAHIELKYSEVEYSAIQTKQLSYEKINKSYVSQLDLSFADELYVSTYSPFFVISKTGDIDQFILEIQNIACKDFFISIEIYQEFERVYDRAPISDCVDMECLGGGGDIYYDTLGAIPISHGTTDLDLKIGVVEADSTPYFLDDDLANMNWKIQSGHTAQTGTHGTDVVKELKQSYDDVSDTQNSSNEYVIYATSAGTPRNIYYAVDWMIESGVSIINLSFGISTINTYSNYQKYFDYIASTYNILFVIADTNSINEQTDYVTYPGLAFNSITVAGIDRDFNYDYKSGFKESFIISKPNFVDNNGQPDTLFNRYVYGGNSYSAPRTVARIAKLQFFYPELKNNLNLLLAVVHAASSQEIVDVNPRNYDLSGFDDKIGAGYFNFNNAISIMTSDNFTEVTVNLADSGELLFHQTYEVKDNEILYFSTSTLTHIDVLGFLYYGEANYTSYTVNMYMNDVLIKTLSDNNIIYTALNFNEDGLLTIQIISNESITDDTRLNLSWRIA